MPFIALILLAVLLVPATASAQAPFSGSYDAHNDEDWSAAANKCSLPSPITGAEPEGAGPYPVLIWITGTGAEGGWTGWPAKLTSPFDQALAKAVVGESAASGFVSAFGQYRGRWTVGNDTGTDKQAGCMFSRSESTRSILDVVCARPKADCSRVVVAGHSQGGMIAMRAANHDANVRAAFATGVFCAGRNPTFWTSRERGGGRSLPDASVRIATGRSDSDSWLTSFSGCKAGDYTAFRTFTGLTCPDGTVHCFRQDGSGWHIVQHAAPPHGPSDKVADHCFMSVNGGACREPQGVDAFWLKGAAPWTLSASLGWLKHQAG